MKCRKMETTWHQCLFLLSAVRAIKSRLHVIFPFCKLVTKGSHVIFCTREQHASFLFLSVLVHLFFPAVSVCF